MDDHELARAVAADLGADVLAAVEVPPVDDKTRAFGITEAMAIGGFLVQCAQLAIQVWQAKQDRALLVAALANSDALMQAYPRLDPEKRMGLVARVLAKMIPESFARPVHDQTAADTADKQAWVADYAEKRREAAIAKPLPPGTMAPMSFVGATILQPFADQRWWALRDGVGWVPDAADGPGLTRVDVRKGFVTDLASVPSYLWVVLQKTGRYGNAAIYHDWLYWEQSCTRAVADRVFDRAMHDMGVDAVTRNLIWAGVRVFGGSAWDGNTLDKAAGARRILKTFPDKPTITWDEWRLRPDVFA